MLKQITILWLFLFSIVLNVFGEAENTIIIPTDDAYVLADLSDPSDSLGLMQTNTEKLERIELLSAWNVTENQNTIVTIGYLKFDLVKQNIHNLQKAELKMFSSVVQLSEIPKNVVLLHVPNNNWKESDITYLKRPSFSTTIASSAEIISSDTWYSWDVTELVRQNAASELSVALTFETGRDNTQDYVSFYSKEVSNSDFSPFLELTFTAEPEFAVLDGLELGTASLYAGIAIAASGIIVGYFISKKRSKASDGAKPIQRPRVKCSTCNSLIPTNFKFCPICGSKMNTA